jgi:nicotinamide-nucleotide amidase
MHCEVIAVGTELLLGQIVDTNSVWLGEQLALAGIDSHFQTKVGDNLERIVSALQIALDRSEAVLMCGGLGPTHDDITRDAIARVMSVPLVRDEHIAAQIQAMFKARGREMPANNLRQADVPQGAAVIPEMPGTAPGLLCRLGDKVVYAVPGVPYEMKQMVLGTVLPDLQRRAGGLAVIKSRTLRTWGQLESGLADLLAGRIAELDKTGNPTLAFLASGIEGIKVRITAKAPDHATVDRMLAEEDARLRALLGDLVFGRDEETMESVVIDLLRHRGLTIGVAESLTGGLISARLSAVPGAVEGWRGAIVSHADAVHRAVLNLPVVPTASAETAKAMALAVCQVLGADVGLAITGVTEPGEPQDQPVGTVFLSLAIAGAAEVQQVRLPGDRERIRQFSVISLLNLLRLRLLAGDADGYE